MLLFVPLGSFGMKQKKLDTKVDHQQQEKEKIEILKAVAQAWHARSTTCKSTNESDASRMSFQARPSRFKLEAITTTKSSAKAPGSGWDFKQSLWDPHEIVAVSKRLERGLVSDNPVSESGDGQGQRVRRRRRKESKNSLRSLFNLISSRRFSEVAAPLDDDDAY